MQFPAIWKPKLQKFSLWINHESTSRKLLTKQTVKKLNLWGKATVDKSAWIKP